ncbi:NADPH:quinone oxidoreductase family protein [Ectothiorhodospiraceae bacterium WFHF3C12]|nr:NADPH:quinone oxidoreductase family protein [Ectothiorhodospiraceae bacterium WFHF3C12]
MSYQAILCELLDGPGALALRRTESRALADGEVRVAVKAAGVNFPDLLMTRGGYQLRLEPPFTPGMEVSGTVTEVHSRAGGWQPGDAVIATMRSGGYAEEVVVPAESLLALPPGFSFEEGAAFPVAARTAYHSLVDRAGLRSGETLLVLGASGGVGLAAVELGAVLGAHVIAVGSDDEKLAVAAAKGAEAVVNYRTEAFRDTVKALTDPHGVDVVYDPVGGTLSKESARLLAWEGRLLIIGFASGEIPSFAANHALIKGYSIMGVRAGESARRFPERARAGTQRLLELAAQGHLRPHISHSFPLAEAAGALRTLETRAVVGRCVLTCA